MIKPILTDKKLLSEPSFTADYYSIDEVVKDLRDTAATLNKCAGIAAPQIGHKLRIILVNVQGAAIVMINPEYINKSGKNAFGNESCFSVPTYIKSPKRDKRFYKVHVAFTDEQGNRVTRRFKNFEARLIQHEIDHLDGKLI